MVVSEKRAVQLYCMNCRYQGSVSARTARARWDAALHSPLADCTLLSPFAYLIANMRRDREGLATSVRHYAASGDTSVLWPAGALLYAAQSQGRLRVISILDTDD